MNSRVQLTHLVCFKQQHIRIPGGDNDDDDADADGGDDDGGDDDVGGDDVGDDNVGDDDDGDGDDDLCARCPMLPYKIGNLMDDLWIYC